MRLLILLLLCFFFFHHIFSSLVDPPTNISTHQPPPLPQQRQQKYSLSVFLFCQNDNSKDKAPFILYFLFFQIRSVFAVPEIRARERAKNEHQKEGEKDSEKKILSQRMFCDNIIAVWQMCVRIFSLHHRLYHDFSSVLFSSIQHTEKKNICRKEKTELGLCVCTKSKMINDAIVWIIRRTKLNAISLFFGIATLTLNAEWPWPLLRLN